MTNQQPKRSPVALLGMLTAVAVVLAFLAQIVPILFGFAAPLPMIVAVIMFGFKQSMLVAAASSILVAVLLGPISGVSFFCQYALVGSLCGAFVKAKKSYGTTFLATTLAQALGMGLLALVQLALMGFDVAAFAQTYLSFESEMLKNAQETGLYATMAAGSGMSAAEAKLIFKQSLTMVMQVMPSLFALFFAATSAIVLWLSDKLCVGMRLDVRPQAPKWHDIIMPYWVTAIFIASWVALLLNNRFLDNQLLWIVAVNVMVIGVACMALDGLSYVLAKLKLSEKSMLWQLFYLMFALFMGVYLIFVLAFFGIFDAIMDFRHLRDKGKGATTK